MTAVITSSLPYLVLLSHAFFILIVLAFVFRNSWGKGLANWVSKNALPLTFIVSLTAVLGSLFYSEIIGFEPCVLCWWQRIFLYPIVIIAGTALWRGKSEAFSY